MAQWRVLLLLLSPHLPPHRSPQELKAERAARAPFENTLAARWYFHVTPVDVAQQGTWRRYLEWVVKQSPVRACVASLGSLPAACRRTRSGSPVARVHTPHDPPAQSTARNAYERCVIVCARYPEFWLRFAKFERIHGTNDASIAVLQRALKAVADDQPRPRLALAMAFERGGRVEEARETYTQLARWVHSLAFPYRTTHPAAVIATTRDAKGLRPAAANNVFILSERMPLRCCRTAPIPTPVPSLSLLCCMHLCVCTCRWASSLSSPLMEAVMNHGNFERRQGNIAAAASVFQEALKSTSGESYTYLAVQLGRLHALVSAADAPPLSLHPLLERCADRCWACSDCHAQHGAAADARAVFGAAEAKCGAKKGFWEAFADAELCMEREGRDSRVTRVYCTALGVAMPGTEGDAGGAKAGADGADTNGDAGAGADESKGDGAQATAASPLSLADQRKLWTRFVVSQSSVCRAPHVAVHAQHVTVHGPRAAELC